jgi:NAD(P)-dependent dehydrogenase (short-subunit alcohol dehydrogenase family)
MKPIVVVTGGSQGIGAAVARLAGQRGYAVAISYQRAREAADRVVSDIKHRGGEAVAIQAEMADEASIIGLFESVDRGLGRLTALVNNAGITGPIAKLQELTTDALDEVLAVNVRGAFLVLREAARRMATDRGGAGGAVVNVSSRAAALGGPNEWIHYAASKGAVDTLTIGAAKELASSGIRVNAVSPGLIDTEIHAKAGMPDRIDRMAGGIPLSRAGTAEEVARAVLWLLSEDAAYITGAVLPVSGGR